MKKQKTVVIEAKSRDVERVKKAREVISLFLDVYIFKKMQENVGNKQSKQQFHVNLKNPHIRDELTVLVKFYAESNIVSDEDLKEKFPLISKYLQIANAEENPKNYYKRDF